MTFTNSQWQAAIVALANASGAANIPNIVQTTSAVTGSGAKTVAAQFAKGVTAGNSIVVDYGLGEVPDGSTIILAITDTLGNTYTSATTEAQSTTLYAGISYATNILGDALNSNVEGSSNATKNTVTLTLTGASAANEGLGLTIYEVQGIIELTPAAVDQTAVGTSAGGTSVTTAAVVPGAPNEYAFMAIAAGNGAITAGTGWTLDSGSLAPTGGNLIKFGSQSRFLSSLGSVTPSATLGASVAWAACCATFKPAFEDVQGTLTLASGAAVTATQATAANLNSTSTIQVVTGTSIAPGTNAVPTLNSAATGYVAAYGSNPAALTSNTDYSFKWGAAGTTQVNHVMIQNNSGATCNWDLDVAATAGSPTLANGSTLFLDVQTSTVHLLQTGTPNVNGTTASNIVVRGWL